MICVSVSGGYVLIFFHVITVLVSAACSQLPRHSDRSVLTQENLAKYSDHQRRQS